MFLRSRRIEPKLTNTEEPTSRRSNSVPRSFKLQSPRVILDRSFVSNYFRQQENVEDVLNISTISLHSDSSDDPNKSVQFVNEETATRKIKQIRKINQRYADIKLHGKKLELHVGALQMHIIQHQNDETTPIDASNATDSVDATRETAIEVIENAEAIDLSADLQLSESFIDNQLLEWKQNGELTQVFEDFQAFLNENISE